MLGSSFCVTPIFQWILVSSCCVPLITINANVMTVTVFKSLNLTWIPHFFPSKVYAFFHFNSGCCLSLSKSESEWEKSSQWADIFKNAKIVQWMLKVLTSSSETFHMHCYFWVPWQLYKGPYSPFWFCFFLNLGQLGPPRPKLIHSRSHSY